MKRRKHTNARDQDEMLKSGRLDRKYNGIIDCFSRTAKNEGVMALWRGVSLSQALHSCH